MFFARPRPRKDDRVGIIQNPNKHTNNKGQQTQCFIHVHLFDVHLSKICTLKKIIIFRVASFHFLPENVNETKTEIADRIRNKRDISTT